MYEAPDAGCEFVWFCHGVLGVRVVSSTDLRTKMGTALDHFIQVRMLRLSCYGSGFWVYDRREQLCETSRIGAGSASAF